MYGCRCQIGQLETAQVPLNKTRRSAVPSDKSLTQNAANLMQVADGRRLDGVGQTGGCLPDIQITKCLDLLLEHRAVDRSIGCVQKVKRESASNQSDRSASEIGHGATLTTVMVDSQDQPISNPYNG